jgi:hypothetical protein
LLCVAVLGVAVVFLSAFIWLDSPFFDLRLVFVDAVLVLLMAVLFAKAFMAPRDKRG